MAKKKSKRRLDGSLYGLGHLTPEEQQEFLDKTAKERRKQEATNIEELELQLATEGENVRSERLLEQIGKFFILREKILETFIEELRNADKNSLSNEEIVKIFIRARKIYNSGYLLSSTLTINAYFNHGFMAKGPILEILLMKLVPEEELLRIKGYTEIKDYHGDSCEDIVDRAMEELEEIKEKLEFYRKYENYSDVDISTDLNL